MAATSPSPSPATSDGTARPRAVTFGTVTAALMVPLLIVAGVATSLHTQEIEHGWADRQREACRHLPFPMAEYAAGWAGVVLGVAAVGVCVLLARRLRARYGLRLGDTWPGLLMRHHRVVQRPGDSDGADPAVGRVLGRGVGDQPWRRVLAARAERVRRAPAARPRDPRRRVWAAAL